MLLARIPSRWFAIFLAMLIALAGSLDRARSMPDPEQQRVLGVLASLGATICHGDQTEDPGNPTPDHRNGHDCTLCAICQAPSSALTAPAGHVTITKSELSGGVDFLPFTARAPPAVPHALAQPRGPPSLI